MGETNECENVGGESGTQKVPAASRKTDPCEGSTPENLRHVITYKFLLTLLIKMYK